MKVKQLIEKLKDAEPDALVVTNASDHSYRIVDAYSCEAEQSGNGDLFEALQITSGGEVSYDTTEDGKIIPIVVID